MCKEVTPSHRVFFEESFEGLDAIEMGLLAIQQSESDTETMTTLFRAAQLINAGAASFGFSQLSELLTDWKPCWSRCVTVNTRSAAGMSR